ncbi:MAG TPA: DUF3613 domain-containing protein [Solimonas sp.]|nr:DUF3613 domain-containing protein [Solimonas sp.]
MTSDSLLRSCCALCLVLAALPLAAADPVIEKQGDETKVWLELQRSGVAGTQAPQTMSGEVADQVYERYLKSFAHPIPENFTRDRFVGGGGGGSGGGG